MKRDETSTVVDIKFPKIVWSENGLITGMLVYIAIWIIIILIL